MDTDPNEHLLYDAAKNRLVYEDPGQSGGDGPVLTKKGQRMLSALIALQDSIQRGEQEGRVFDSTNLIREAGEIASLVDKIIPPNKEGE